MRDVGEGVEEMFDPSLVLGTGLADSEMMGMRVLVVLAVAAEVCTTSWRISMGEGCWSSLGAVPGNANCR